MMRIIAGTRRGRRLATLPGEDTRPTLERVKQGLFSAIQFELEGRAVLDLFAGSGQLGLEALSRGARSCWFNDHNPKALEVVCRNIRACRFENIAKETCAEHMLCVKMIQRAGFLPDLVFLDPPYRQNRIQEVLAVLAPDLRPGALVAAESAAAEQFDFCGLSLRREYFYGPVKVTLLEKRGQDQ